MNSQKTNNKPNSFFNLSYHQKNAEKAAVQNQWDLVKLMLEILESAR